MALRPKFQQDITERRRRAQQAEANLAEAERTLGGSPAVISADEDYRLLDPATVRPMGSGIKDSGAARRHQPRQHHDSAKQREITESIRENGQLVPGLVRPVGDGFELRAGERRWRACSELGIKFKAVVKAADDRTAYREAVIENAAREDLNEVDAGHAYETLKSDLQTELDEVWTQHEKAIRKLGAASSATIAKKLPETPSHLIPVLERGSSKLARTGQRPSVSYEDVARIVGKSLRQVEYSISISRLPEKFQEPIRDGRITPRQARVIAGAKAAETQKVLMEGALRGFTGDDLEKLAKLPEPVRGPAVRSAAVTAAHLPALGHASDPEKLLREIKRHGLDAAAAMERAQNGVGERSAAVLAPAHGKPKPAPAPAPHAAVAELGSIVSRLSAMAGDLDGKTLTAAERSEIRERARLGREWLGKIEKAAA